MDINHEDNLGLTSFTRSVYKKLFYLDAFKVNLILFTDNSDDEEKLILDDEDLYYLEKKKILIKEDRNTNVLKIATEAPQPAAN